MFAKFKSLLAQESENLFLFAPIFFGLGAALYFYVFNEPSGAFCAALFCLSLAGFLLAKEIKVSEFRTPIRLFAIAVLLAAAGFANAKIHTALTNTKLASESLRGVRIKGTVDDMEIVEGGYRFILQNATADGKPAGRIRFRTDSQIAVPRLGSTIEFDSFLLPPFSPFALYGFDFARWSFYRKINGSSKLYDDYIYSEIQNDTTTFQKLKYNFINFREYINSRILSSVAQPSAGILIAITTGGTHAIEKETYENYRKSGVAHITSISGYHMSILIATIFFITRMLLVFIPAIALRYNTKKLAAAIAMIVSFFYLAISGFHVAATRAFLMANLVMVAVVLDKSVFSLRSLAIAAMAILTFSPKSILNPGFQLSFLAVAILMKIYEARDKWKTKSKIINAVKGTMIISLFISVLTNPFIIYSFKQMQIYDVLGNLSILPAEVLVMPSIALAFILMPFGLDIYAFKMAGFGIGMINASTSFIAALPYADIPMKAMPHSAFALCCVGIIFLVLLKTKLKFIGIIPIVAGMIIYFAAPVPKLFVDRFGTAFGIVEDNRLVIINRSKYKLDYLTREAWLERAGLREYNEIADSDATAEIPFDIDKNYNRSFFRTAGGAEFYYDGKGGYYYKTNADFQGNRPWSPKR
ncbi:MAG: competence protein ComEC family protein [Alphaproteobacteria bacterium]|nr:competence protein ComEC family protein [Alphaproteobacteria bacterium]